MQLAYQKIMAEYNLTNEELPSEIKDDIKEIQKIVNNIKAIKGRGQSPQQSLMDNLKKRDRLLVNDIEDYYEDKSENEEESQMNKVDNNIAEGLSLESELENLYKTGVKDINISDLKNSCPKCYSKIFSTYEKGGDNGIKTSRFSIIEIKEQPETFNLKTR
jgi:hypothetical protein